MGRPSVLPIKNVDKGKFVDLDSPQKIKKEFRGCVGMFVKLLLELLSVTFFVFLDHILSSLLSIIARHSQINFHQEGVHKFNITVQGEGFIANLIRESVDEFNVDERIKVMTSNEPCLPRPVIVELWKIIRIYLLFLLNLYLILNQVYIHRSKRFVCSYFFPKREKQRVLYLYNKLLKRHKNLFKLMVRRVKEKLEVHDGVKYRKKNFLQVIYTINHRLSGGRMYKRHLNENMMAIHFSLYKLFTSPWSFMLLT
jgi:E3 ubiquitin-protein ligase DCST1